MPELQINLIFIDQHMSELLCSQPNEELVQRIKKLRNSPIDPIVEDTLRYYTSEIVCGEFTPKELANVEALLDRMETAAKVSPLEQSEDI